MPGMLAPLFRRSAVAAAVALATLIITPAQAGLSDSIEDAATLLREGELIRAKDTLYDLRRKAETTADRERIFELLAAAESRLNHMPGVEISIQKAELAIEKGDLRTARMQANAAMRADRASASHRQRASDLLDTIAKRRMEFEPLAVPMLRGAIRDFEEGNYADAKAGLAAVKRMDVELSQPDRATLNRYQSRIFELERDRGAPFDTASISFGALRNAAGVMAAAAPAGFQPAEPEPVETPGEEQEEQEEQESEQDADQPEEDAEEQPAGEGDEPAVKSPTLGRAEGWHHTFDAPGDYPYYCAYHPHMKGTVTVRTQSGA